MTELKLTGMYRTGSPLHKGINEIINVGKKTALEELQEKYKSIFDRYVPPSIARKDEESLVNNSSDHPGDKIIDSINRFLNKLYRSPQQKQFHQAFLASCLRIIYRDDFDKEKHRVMAKYKFKSRKQQVLVCAPRRMGKTFSTAFFCIVFAIILSEVELSIFSPGKRQSVALMGVIVDFMKKLGEGDRIVRRNEEKLQIRSLDGRISKVNAYPSAVKTLKGVSGTVVILEEMAQIPPEVLFEVVVPLHQIDITSVIGISTITDENNFMTKYLKQKDAHGEPLFAVEQIWLACKPCRDKGIAHKCNHKSHLLPNWSSARKRKIINQIMKNQEEMLAREIGGVASALHQKAFPIKFVNKFKSLPPYKLTYDMTYDHIFHAIDPNGAGKSSDYAIISMIRVNGQSIIIGIESFPSKTALENDNFLVNHINRLRLDSRFEMARSVIIVESNLGLESDRISYMLEENLTNYVFMDERNDESHRGFRTTQNMKTMAVETIRERILDNSLRIADEETLVSARGYDTAVAILIDQMSEFAEMLKTNDVDKPKKSYSGKANGRDDVIMALLIMMHWCSFWYKSPKYAHYHL
jgi:hypothetical protein